MSLPIAVVYNDRNEKRHNGVSMTEFIKSDLLVHLEQVTNLKGPFAVVQLHERINNDFCRTLAAIAVSSVIHPFDYLKPAFFVPTYARGIKHKPFTFIDYANVTQSLYEGAIMRTGGMKVGELNVFMAGRRRGMSQLALEALKDRGDK